MKNFKEYLTESDDLFIKKTSIDYTKDYKLKIKSAYEAAIKLLNTNNEIPQHLLDLISKNLYYSFDISRKLVNKHIDIPKQLLTVIINSPSYTIIDNLAWAYVNYNPERFPNIPKELVNKIKENEGASKHFIKMLNDNIEKMKKNWHILQKEEYSEKLHEFLKENPEFLEHLI